MTKQKIIMNGSNPQQENRERERIVNNISFQEGLKESQRQQKAKMNILHNIALMGGGMGLGFLAMGFMPSSEEEFNPENPILLPEDPQQAIGVNDQMSYNQAWEVSREEVGAGGYFVWHSKPFSTYTQEEWNNLNAEEQQLFQSNMNDDYNENIKIETDEPPAFVVHDMAPVAESVSDEMSFGDAFAMARQEVGAGGIFQWKGNTYGTYYKEEWENMTKEDKNEFAQSYQKTDNSNDISYAEVEEVPEVVDNAVNEVFIGSEVQLLPDGSKVNVGYFVQDNQILMKIDLDNNNQYDYVVDTSTNQLIGLNGNEDIDLNQLTQVGSVEPIMSETMQIEGYNALVTVYSDGSQTAQVDMDNDGTYDTTLTVDTTGQLQVYDSTGQLIATDQLNMYDNSQDIDQQLIDDQLAENFGDDFDDNGDISNWINEDPIL